jgi:N-acylneuraminate cytidylyltransferase
MKLAVIPARGGSKRIPRKNIKEFCGKPIIAWSIKVALESECFDQVIVSTDDPEIAEIAKKCGAKVPFIRPAALSNDHCATIPVIQHAISWYEQQQLSLEAVCCIYAAAPFIQALDLKSSYEVLIEQECDFSFPMTSFSFPIQRGLWKTADNRIEMIQPEHNATRSQDLPEAYHDAGQFYWGTRDAWLAEKKIFGSASVPIILSRHRVQDIDTPEDWLRAELMFKMLQDINNSVER